MKSSLLRLLLGVLSAAWFALTAFAAPAPSAPAAIPPARAHFKIYLLMGQSNMVGRDTRDFNAQPEDPHILVFNADQHWVIARDPLFPPYGKIPPGVSAGLSFARALRQAQPDETIGLVPCAVGGTPLRRWVKGGDLYERAVQMAKAAAGSGEIVGVLWHQGESDTEHEADATTYETRLARMFVTLRDDLGLPNLPIVVGQLGPFLSPAKYPYVDTVRTALQRLPRDVVRVGFVDSAGLGDKGDRLHFSAAAQREFGARYATAMLALLRQPVPPLPAPAAKLSLWPAGRMPGTGANAAEHELPARGDGAHRVTDISEPTLLVYPAAHASRAAPAMLVCPGGGYSYVVVDKEGTEIAAWLNAAGITAVVLKYRVPHNHDGALQDVQRALSLVRAHAGDWAIDPHRLGIIGFSAGGNLGAKASTLFAHRAYTPVDAADQLSCRPDLAVLVYPAYLERDGKLATDLDLTAKVPPTLLVHNEDDHTFVAGSKLYHAALDAAGAPNQFLLYQTGGHGYALHCTGEARAWPVDALAWLHRQGF